MREQNLYNRIQQAVESGSVKNQFKATDFDFLKVNSRNFLWKHSDKNKNPKKSNEYFIRVSRGLYKLKKPAHNIELSLMVAS